MLDYGKKCVVIDLDETLVHSSFKVNRHEKPFVTSLLRTQLDESWWLLVCGLIVREEIPRTVVY